MWLAIVLAARLGAQTNVAAKPEFLPHPAESTKRIEYFLAQPHGAGPWPMLVFVHGHQDGDRPGGAVYATTGMLQRTAAKGILAAAVSQPGYGQSDGPPDFAGPRTQDAIIAVVEHLRGRRDVRSDRVGLYGYSRGAIAAAMVGVKLPSLRVLILGAGMYDVRDGYRRLDRSRPELDGLAKNMEREIGTAYAERSALPLAGRIQAATLLLHGEKDDRCPLQGAKQLAEALERSGTPVTLEVFPNAGHGIPPAQREKPIDAFIERWLLTR